jgi:hypothetical protein
VERRRGGEAEKWKDGEAEKWKDGEAKGRGWKAGNVERERLTSMSVKSI